MLQCTLYTRHSRVYPFPHRRNKLKRGGGEHRKNRFYATNFHFDCVYCDVVRSYACSPHSELNMVCIYKRAVYPSRSRHVNRRHTYTQRVAYSMHTAFEQIAIIQCSLNQKWPAALSLSLVLWTHYAFISYDAPHMWVRAINSETCISTIKAHRAVYSFHLTYFD